MNPEIQLLHIFKSYGQDILEFIYKIYSSNSTQFLDQTP